MHAVVIQTNLDSATTSNHTTAARLPAFIARRFSSFVLVGLHGFLGSPSQTSARAGGRMCGQHNIKWLAGRHSMGGRPGTVHGWPVYTGRGCQPGEPPSNPLLAPPASTRCSTSPGEAMHWPRGCGYARPQGGQALIRRNPPRPTSPVLLQLGVWQHPPAHL
jgi:hypothetical protein